MSRGRFIVLEGIDGTGKTTHVTRLATWLRARGRDVVETREPTGGTWGRRYRAWARGDFEATPEEVLDMFLRDRREHVDALIEPALARGAFVVCDRYVASTQAYQSAHGNDRDHVASLLAAFPAPDLTLWLRASVDVALERLAGSAAERFERRAFLERVDAEYARLDLVQVDASGSIDEIQERLRKHVEALEGA